MKNNIFILVIVMCLSWIEMFSQRPTGKIEKTRVKFECGSDQLHYYLMKNDIDYSSDYNSMVRLIENKSFNKRSVDCQHILTIPVAFHFGEGVTSENMECIDLIASEQIKALNRDFGGKNANLNDYLVLNSICPNEYPLSALSQGTCIQFKLANQNHPLSSDLLDGKPAYTFNEFTYQTGATGWSGYLNFFINNDVPIDPNTGLVNPDILGLEPRPIPAMSPINHGEKGIWLSPKVFGGGNIACISGDTLNNTINLGLGRVAVHEVGHYFGLHHPFSNPYVDEINGDCSTDDGFDDTPSQDAQNVSYPIIDYTDCYAKINGEIVANHCGTKDFFFNYMDYTDDAAKMMFTQQQVAFMNTLVEDTYNAGLIKTDVIKSVDIEISNAPCFNIIYADYAYQCGENLLTLTTGEQIYFSGRNCGGDTSTPTITTSTNNNTGGGGSTGPGSPSGTGGGSTTTTSTVNPGSDVPVINENDECQECVKELQRKIQLIKAAQNGNN